MTTIGMDKRIIQVYSSAHRAGASGDFSGRPPTILVTINEDKTPYKALLDTGAENTTMDLRIAERLNLPEVSQGRALGMTGEGKTSIVSASVNIVGVNVKFDCHPHLTNSDEMRYTSTLFWGAHFYGTASFMLMDHIRSIIWSGLVEVTEVPQDFFT